MITEDQLRVGGTYWWDSDSGGRVPVRVRDISDAQMMGITIINPDGSEKMITVNRSYFMLTAEVRVVALPQKTNLIIWIVAAVAAFIYVLTR